MDPRHIVHLENGRLASTPRDLLRDTFRGLPAHPHGRRVVIHVHGGLVSMERGLEVAERLLPVYERARCFPIFVVWESDARETIVNHLSEIAGDPFFRALLRIVLRFAKAKVDAARAGSAGGLAIDDGAFEVAYAALASGDEPYASFDLDSVPSDIRLTQIEERQFRDALEKDPVLQREAAHLCAVLSRNNGAGARHALFNIDTLMTQSVLRDVGRELASRPVIPFAMPRRLVAGVVRVLYRTVKRLATGHDHGLYPTAFEEVLREFYLGTAIAGLWELMKADTSDAFEPDGRRFGGTALVDEVDAAWAAGYRPDITLVGHSAGSLFTCRWLQQADLRLARPVAFNVVTLAAALTFDLVDAVITAHGRRIDRIRLFGLADALERRDALVPGVYPRSLLYFVSGVLEGEADRPLVGLQRHHVAGLRHDQPACPAVGRVLRHLAGHPGSTVWSPRNGVPGQSSAATTHGSIDDDETTLESLVHFIAEEAVARR
ncbi:MAG: hypothetical protein AB1806_01310 [Acidobacteriota bacterium]